jgi:hypothetical protein
MQRKQRTGNFGNSNVVICWTLLHISHTWQHRLMPQAPSAPAAATVLYREASTDYFGIAYMNFEHLEGV